MTGLFERAAEVAALERTLVCAEQARGQVLMLAGQAGVGKSALIGHARELAHRRGFTVLGSNPTPVSLALAHGVVRDWLAPLVHRGRPGEKPFDGPAAHLAAALAHPDPDPEVWGLGRLDYALTWLLENLYEQSPVLLIVDDVQWADPGSLEVLDLVSARIGASPAVLLLGRRTGERGARVELVERIGKRAQVLRPAPLSVLGVEQMCRQLDPAGEVARRPAARVHQVTGGIPFLVRELIRSGSDGHGQAPPLVVESVKARLTRLGADSLEIARTVAVLGEEATFDAVAALCGTAVADLADPLARLADSDLVRVGLWRAWPAHPLVSEAILGSLPPSEISTRHRRAADYLAGLGRSRQVIASHLVRTLPGEDPRVVELLQSAAQESLEAGVPQVAATQLLRAVGERRPEETDSGLLCLAAAAHMRAGLTGQALELWELARSRAARPEDEAMCLADIGDAQMTVGDRTAARATYRRARDLLVDGGHDRSSQALRGLVARMGMAQAIYDGGHDEVRAVLEEAVSQPADRDTHADRLIFALAGSALAFGGRDADGARRLALRAEARGRLLDEETCDGPGYFIAAGVLTWTDSFTDAFRTLDAAVAQARERGSVFGFATASYCRGFVHYRRGDLREAVTDLDGALAMRERGWNAYVEPALAGLTFAHVGLGQIEEAQALEPELRVAAGSGNQLIQAFAIAAAGLVQASLGNHTQALEDYAVAEKLTTSRAGSAAFAEWRELAVYSLLAQHRPAEAVAAAEAAVRTARAWGSPRSIGFALRAQAAAVAPEQAVPLLREAIGLFESCDAVDQRARAALELGRILIRSPATRPAGLALVQEALEHARRTDVPPVVRAASRVLVQHGLKIEEPVDSPLRSLTPGERRVVELAAAGHSNRQIAQELFVTVKAVEWHLSNAYRKLSVSSRAQLPDVLAGQPAPRPSGPASNSSDR